MISALALATALLTSPAQTRDWPSSGGFDVIQLEDTCVITSTYSFDGRADVKMSLFFDGETARLLLTSLDWSNREGQAYPMIYGLGENAYEGEAVGIVTGYINKGFVESFAPSFLDHFAKAPDLLVMTGETVVTHLSLRGSSGAVTTLRRCVNHVRQANAAQARREQRWDYIAEDPFASAPPPAPIVPGVIMNPAWARMPTPEFPERAASRGITEGRVEVACIAAANGSVASCSIVTESPAGAGFGQAALSSLRRARLAPSAAVDGARIQTTVRFEAPSQ